MTEIQTGYVKNFFWKGKGKPGPNDYGFFVQDSGQPEARFTFAAGRLLKADSKGFRNAQEKRAPKPGDCVAYIVQDTPNGPAVIQWAFALDSK